MVEMIGVMVLFLLLSLLERWARGQAQENKPETGERPGQLPAPPRPRGAGTKPRRQRAGARKPPGQAPLPQELPQVERPAAVRESARLPAAQDLSPVLREPALRKRDRHFKAFAGFRGRNDLRRAIVMKTVLGPPRASRPYSVEGV